MDSYYRVAFVLLLCFSAGLAGCARTPGTSGPFFVLGGKVISSFPLNWGAWMRKTLRVQSSR
jgi:hypothetical protein